MTVELEKAYEDEICEALHASGWIYTSEMERPGYDKTRALFVPDVLAWLQETQPEAYGKVVKPEMSATEQAKAVDSLLDRLVKVLDLPLGSGGGTLNVLRKGFDKTPAKFKMAEFKPVTTLNPAVTARHGAMRLRVMRQVYYSTKNTNSIDLVLFVNGLPVATLELKTDNTQSIEHAKKQYRDNRQPAGEPLLGFGNRCLVHFAVSNEEVAMTTRLAGAKTFFLPFNVGRDAGAGNPQIPGKAASAYLWERVLQPEAWLHILGKMMHLEERVETDPITGAQEKKSILLFPRFHQWDLVSKTLQTVADEGPGHNYLVQHSAGSGKTNSIAWTAHGLATLHDENNEKVFDSVIVVTDRTVLDDQLQKAIKQIEGTSGTVSQINIDEARKAGAKSKSALLADELLSGKLIVIVTMQTFPHALKAIREDAGLSGRKFAIIADEAHSSQTGRTSQKLRAVLTAEEAAELDDGGEIDVEAVLAAEMAERAESKDLSFFAFTATPKSKTLELFGRSDGGGSPRPFHVYTMQQAIEEGYILDVLRNYTSYDTAFQIAQQVKKSAGERHLKAVKLVDESEATTHLMRWVSLHPTNIAQKVQIIVEHYRTNVRHLLDGHAKAMVVTSSREHAIRYKDAIDAYIKKSGYTDVATLVAFSGTMTAEQVPGVLFAGVEPPYSETNLNKGLRGRTIPTALGSNDFQVLIVANKYQTGFDQPLLCTMYVDKRLDGVSAVQTLSRLNRTYPSAGKDTTYVVDFVNEPAEILEAFLPYYKDAEIDGTTDPDQVHDLRAKLDHAGIYTPGEVDAFATAYLNGNHGAVSAPLGSAAARFADAWRAAQAAADKARLDELELFRKDVGSYVRLYDFLSQIVNYEDPSLEKLARFLRLLKGRLIRPEASDIIDLSSVELTHIKQARAKDQTLDLGSGDVVPLKPMKATGSGQSRDPHMVLLEEVLAKVNALFDGEDFTPGQQRSWVEGLVTVLGESDTVRSQAVANTSKQFVESPDLSDAVHGAVLDASDAHSKMTDMFFSDDVFKAKLVTLLGELVYDDINRLAR
ncbi:type I restriction endonuclease subunit R [Aeromicrobium duanguangcaii]|uniref:DEAD/DEAH box helicase family protein n=1 Tax=Aeromicrobium duanguangcaii TaxID=2968086 RepID=A0ABY5KHG8_9ACTN|nr:type I restriction endonuclease [Aeromicrobium duanguangcaii]MCD9153114.1 DEAD/DEAH box helicase family protein [Aeromicrobium duanguangcaii]UUI69785.1 DEAD/DEAH box helicase family protein [Aeromicrobium duanguangcaii]